MKNFELAQKLVAGDSAERKRYEPPQLKKLGTIQQLTKSLPGASPTDNDPFTPGSTF